MKNCPHCGGTLPSPARKRQTLTADPVDTAAMTDAQVFAFYKRTAPARYLADYLARDIDPAWRPKFEALDGLKGGAFFKAFYSLKDSYACWRNRPADVAAYEARFWTSRQFINRRRNAATWRATIASVKSDIQKRASGQRTYSYGYAGYGAHADDGGAAVVKAVVDLVRKGRELFGNVPALAKPPKTARLKAA